MDSFVYIDLAIASANLNSQMVYGIDLLAVGIELCRRELFSLPPPSLSSSARDQGRIQEFFWGGAEIFCFTKW